MPVDRHSPTPLWAQILEDLRLRMAADEFSERFPGDLELVRHYGVSRQTVREAIRRLQQEGVVERVRGQGSSVRPRPLEQSLGTLYSLYRSAEAQGFVQQSVVRVLEERTDAAAAAALDCDAKDPLVYLERLRLLDGTPAVLDWSYLPARLARPLLKVDFQRTALYRELERACRVRPDSGWERMSPLLPAPAERRLLGLDPVTPTFLIERLAQAGGAPVEWRHSIVRADRFQFVSRWSSGRVGAAFEPPAELRPPRSG